MITTEEALRLAEKACLAGKECENLLAKVCIKLGIPDLASEFLDQGVFNRALAAINEVKTNTWSSSEYSGGEPIKQDHIPDATKMVAEPTVKESLTTQEPVVPAFLRRPGSFGD